MTRDNTSSAHYTLSHLYLSQTHQLRTLCNSLYAVHEWNCCTGTTQLHKSVFLDNSNNHIHCIWAKNGAANSEVMWNNSINYSHAVKTDNELAKIKAHPKTCTKTSLQGAPSYTLGQFRTSNCVTRYTQKCTKLKFAYKCGLHETLKNKELVL